jgi:DNA-binding MarR family transcriptional regulator
MDHLELASALRGVVSDLHKRLKKQIYSNLAQRNLSVLDSLSITETNTLSYLYKQGTMFPSELADINKIKKQSMSQVLNHLEELKMIKRVVLKEDKRKTAITLTESGKKMVEKSRYERDEWLAGAIGEMLSEKDVKALAAAIPLLVKIADAK